MAILGGGLAGLTLAIQLKQARPDTSVAVLEKREGPAPLAAFKVGESTVPAGAHYFAEVVGMEDHLRAEAADQVRASLLLPAGGNSDITKRVELGADRFPPHDNFQLDRGLFENELAAGARCARASTSSRAVACRTWTSGRTATIVTFTQGEADDIDCKARWVVDAAGRASLLKRKLGLAKEVAHTINSAWFRLGGGLDFEQWGARQRGVDGARCPSRASRQYSTNHLLGEGYWVWLIPLSSGPISIGVCADPRIHPFDEINELDA